MDTWSRPRQFLPCQFLAGERASPSIFHLCRNYSPSSPDRARTRVCGRHDVGLIKADVFYGLITAPL